MGLTRIKGSVAEELLRKYDNLGDVPSPEQARNNLGVPPIAPADGKNYAMKDGAWVALDDYDLIDLQQRVSDNEQAIAASQQTLDELGNRQQWQFKTIVDVTDPADDRQLGGAVAFSADGQWLAVGARLENTTAGADAGAVYVYQRTTGGFWQRFHHIKGVQAGKQFGYSVALSNDGAVLAIGSPYATASDGKTGGAVFIYSRNDSGTSYAKVTDVGFADNPQGLVVRLFGSAIALSYDGKKLAVGAWDSDLSGANRGFVVCFTPDERSPTPGSWSPAAPVYGDAAEDQAGRALAISGDGSTIAIGSPRKLGLSGQRVGSVKLYSLADDGTMTQYRSYQPEELKTDCRYGCSVSLNDDASVLAVGAADFDINKATNVGAVFVHQVTAQPSADSYQLVYSPMPFGDNLFAEQVAVSGDGQQVYAGDEQAYFAYGLYRLPSLFVWQKDGVDYHYCQQLRAPGGYNNANGNHPAYARAFAVAGKVLAVGAPEARTAVDNQGYVYLYSHY